MVKKFMQKYFALFFGVTLVLFVSGAVPDTNMLIDPNFKRLYVGFSSTTGISYRLLKKTERYVAPTPPFKGVFDLRNECENPYISYELGLRFGVNVTRFLSIETGLNYASMTYKFTDKSEWTIGSGWNGNGYDSSVVSTISGKTGYHFIDIPLGLNFQIGQKKCKALIGVGGAINVALGEWSSLRVTSGVNDEPIFVRKTNFPYRLPQRRVNFSPFFTAGFSYAFNPSIVLYVAPTFSMQSLENIKDAQITEYLWATGLNVGLNFRFKQVK